MQQQGRRGRPRVNQESQRALDRVEDGLNEFDTSIKEVTYGPENTSPIQEPEPQTKLSTKEKAKCNDIYLKPSRSIASREKFNEEYRKDYERAKEYVYFTAENYEVIGEHIEMWTKPFPGMPAEFWKVPVNVPIFAHRYVAEQIRRKSYSRFVTDNRQVIIDGGVSYQGSVTVENKIRRLNAMPESKRISVFTGAYD